MDSVICRVFSMNCNVYWCENIVSFLFSFVRCVCHLLYMLNSKMQSDHVQRFKLHVHHSFWATELQVSSRFFYYLCHRSTWYIKRSHIRIMCQAKELPWLWFVLFYFHLCFTSASFKMCAMQKSKHFLYAVICLRFFVYTLESSTTTLKWTHDALMEYESQ